MNKTMKDFLASLAVAGILLLMWIVSSVGAAWIDTHPSTSLSFGSSTFLPVFLVSVLGLCLGVLIGRKANISRGKKK